MARDGERRHGSGPVIVWSAGEVSGDRHAAEVVRELRRLRPDVVSVGLGGPAMAAAGVELVASMDEVSVVGLTEVFGRLPRILRVWHRLRVQLKSRPALFVPVDFPGLNLRLAGLSRSYDVPVVYFISPQIWAWGAGRLPRIRERVSRMLVVFPFEVPLYEEAGVPVTLVGHPLIEQVAQVPDRAAARSALGIEPAARVLVLMPGSRRSEMSRLLEPMLGASARLVAAEPDLRLIVRISPGLPSAPVRVAAGRHGLSPQIVEEGDARAVRAADLALVASGTATLETGLLGTPMVVVYRVSPITYAIARRLVRIDSIGLVNVVAGRRVVPELIQTELSVASLAQAAGELLAAGPAREAQLAALSEVAASLGGPGAAAAAARAIADELEQCRL